MRNTPNLNLQLPEKTDKVDVDVLSANFEKIDDTMGNPSQLNTTEKVKLVGAINEINNKQGSLTSLKTTSKTNLVSAINELADSVYSVGDVKFGNSLDSNWVRLNGTGYKKIDYPELYKALGSPVNAEVLLEPVKRIGPTPAQLRTTFVVGTEQVILLFSNQQTVYRSVDNGRTWSLGTSIPGGSSIMSANNFKVVNGRIYVLNYGDKLYSTTDGLSWTTHSLAGAGFALTASGYNIEYGDGKWVLTAYGSNQYSTSTDLVSWSAKQTVTGLSSNITCIAWCSVNKYWFVGDSDGRVYRTSASMSTWTNYSVGGSTGIQSIFCKNGMVFVRGYKSPTYFLFYSPTNSVSFLSIEITNPANPDFVCIEYVAGTYYAGYGNGLVYAFKFSSTGSFTGSSVYITAPYTYASSGFSDIKLCGNTLMFVGGYSNVENYVYTSDYIGVSYFQVPNIHPNMYVKAK